jgi:hypothetical protein
LNVVILEAIQDVGTKKEGSAPIKAETDFDVPVKLCIRLKRGMQTDACRRWMGKHDNMPKVDVLT